MNEEIERQTAALVLEADTVLQDHARDLLTEPAEHSGAAAPESGSFEGGELFSGPEDDGNDSDMVRLDDSLHHRRCTSFPRPRQLCAARIQCISILSVARRPGVLLLRGRFQFDPDGDGDDGTGNLGGGILAQILGSAVN